MTPTVCTTPELASKLISEHYYSPIELATLWNRSTDTIIHIFEDEPGVQIWERPGNSKRHRRSIRIPESVVQRVKLRLAVK
jgi:hypothetical protein